MKPFDLILLWEILVNTIENMIYVLLFMKCLHLRQPWKNHKVMLFLLVSILGSFLTCLCNFTKIDFIITQLLLLVFDFLAITTLFREDFPKKIFIAIFPSCISILADKITYLIGGFLFPSTLTAFIFQGNHRVYSTVMYLVMCLLLACLFFRLFRLDIYLTPPLCIATYCIIILAILCANTFLDIMTASEQFSISQAIRIRFQFLSAGFLVIFLFLIILIQKIGHTYEKNLKLEQQIYQEQVNQTQLDLSTQAMENIRSWKHDYKNHMVTITALAEQERCSDLLEYLNKLQENLPDYFINVTSGNTAIDAIVTNKLLLAKQAGISFHHMILLPSELPLSSLECTAILGNLLDNSLEACRKLTEQKNGISPWIRLNIKLFRSMLQIQVINSSDGNYHLTPENQLLTTKKDTLFHGYGLQHIRDIVDQQKGILEIKPEKNQFSVNILIPLPGQKGEKET
ncbi:MAG: GHKL domain-containing protein [Lachnospiraceae bacterium]|nr:GHKL domain-containing protein [Lachnospiraceae bacterium]